MADRLLCSVRAALGEGITDAELVPKTDDSARNWFNFVSILREASITIKRDDGTVTVTKVIIKESEVPPNQAPSEVYNSLCTKELMMYQVVLPCFDKIILQYNLQHASLWPKCLALEQETKKLILEDLRDLGYEVADRKGLTYSEATTVMDYIARFHAISLRAIRNGAIDPREFGKLFLADHADDMAKVGMDAFVQAAEETWSEEWNDIIIKTKKFSTVFMDILKEVRSTPAKLEVLNHGDAWCANFLFKRDDRGDPKDMKLIDFQMSYYGSYAFDLHYFFATCCSVDLFHKKDKLLLKYAESLSQAMAQLHLGNAPTYSEVLEEMRRMEAYRLIVMLTVSCIIIAPLEMKPPRMNEDIASYDPAEYYRGIVAKSKLSEFTTRVRAVLGESVKDGVLSQL